MPLLPAIPRRALPLAALFVLAFSLRVQPALAADPAEAFVTANIHKGLEILDNKALSKQQKADQFEQFLISLTDMKRIADFTLGQYRRSAPPADVQTFEAAFQNFAVAVYQSYFSKYAGQSLQVTNSTMRAPTDYIVSTELIDPEDKSGQPPLTVEFRVRTDGPKPVVTDVSVAGVWLSLSQQAQFVSFLGQNNGNVRLLIAHLSDMAKQFK